MDSVRASKSRVPYITAFAVIVAVALGITSVALNIVILTKSNTINTNTNAIQSALHPVSVKTTVPSHTGIPVKGNTTSPLPTTETTASPISSTTSADNNNCQTMSPVSDSPGFKDAAQYLLSGLDESVDPCDDFYGFTCNKYLASINLGPGTSRKGTYDDAQAVVNMQIAGFLNKINASDETISLTERITKVAFDSCMHASSGFYKNTSDVIYEVEDQFGGAPFAGGNLTEDLNLFKVAGYLEQNHALGTIMSSWVSVDYKNVTRNALYISQPDLSMPLDYFTKPQYIDQLIKEQDMVLSVMKHYCNSTEMCDSDVTDDSLLEAAQKVVQFEVLIAMSSWSDDLLRNYRQQYNPFKIVDLNKTYPNIDFSTYLQTMLEGVQKPDEVNLDEVIISTPSYFGWLDSIFDGKTVDKTTIANYMIVQMLMDTSEFWDSSMSRMAKKRNYIPYAMRKGRGVTKIGKRHVRRFDEDPVQVGCLDMLMTYMPYGPGYVYVKNLKKRHAVIADIKKQTHLVIASFQGMMKTLKWMSTDSLHMALNKSNSLYQNYGYPKSLFGDFDNFTKIDAYHQDYAAIVNLTDVYSIMKILKRGLYVREAFRLLTEEGNSFWDWDLRKNFLQSPAMVNAWYQPERNSITFPFAIWNPPYYRIDFPQAYNFAGQGGTGGHELTHGFDDEGVQFDWDGSMTYCDGKNSSSQAYKCGWMDDDSSDGFTDMAQCVVSQYSSQCCPLKTGNVHCANGATTQGENIADLGGQQAAYKAYRQWVEANKKEEDRLPGMVQYTPNQIFWITYGYSWCMKQTDDSMVKQLLTNPHAPAQCRTNNVVQDIPQFGRDFQCKVGSPMYPTTDQRCKVWVGP